MKTGARIAWIMVFGLGLVGIYAGIGIKKLMSICYNIVKYDVKVDFEYIWLTLTLQIKNPSYLKVDIDGYDLDVYLNNAWVANVATKKHTSLNPGGDDLIKIPIKIQYLKTFGAVKSRDIVNSFLRKEFDKIVVSLKGKFDGTILKVKAHVPVDYKISLLEIIKIMDEPASAPC